MLSKLQIQGIRSFGADHPEEIQFFSPLTLILGQNGTGKTTIIECLKYITTGVFPPGTKGAAFVHDPKLDKSAEVKGQIKLQFKGGINNLDCVVHRSMAVTMKGSKGNFKSIDGFLRVKEPGKEPKTISMKCGDLDHEMCAMLGVSKPVLEHVIFCHQEESNWPLGEGKALKQKFDDIFASGRYAKALDTMLKLQKENANEIKVLQVEVSNLKLRRDEANKIRTKIDNFEMQLKNNDSSIVSLERSLKPIQDELKRLEDVEKQVFGVQQELSGVIGEYQALNASVQDLERVVSRERLEIDPSELKAELERLKNRSDDWRAEVDRLQRKKQDLTRKLEQLHREKEKNAIRERELELLNKQLEDKKLMRGKMANQLSELIGQSVFGNLEASDSQDSALASALRRQVTEESQRINQQKAKLSEKFDAEEKTIEEELNEAKGRQSFLENSMREKEREKVRYESEMRKLQAELKDVDNSHTRARQLAADIADAERMLREAEENYSPEVFEQELEELNAKKTKLQEEQQQLTTQLGKASKSVQVETQLRMLRAEFEDKQARAADAERKIRSLVAEDTGSISRDKLCISLDSKLNSLRSKSSKSERDLELAHRKFASTDSAAENSRRRMNESSKELDKLKKRINDLLDQFGEHNLEDVGDIDIRILDLQETLESFQQEMTKLQSNESMLKGYIEDIEKPALEKPVALSRVAKAQSGCGHSSCPLCERPFQSETERSKVVHSIKARLSSDLPERMKQLKHLIPKTKTTLDGLRALRPLFNDRARLEEEISKTQEQMIEAQRESEQLKREAEALKQMVSQERDQITELTALLSDATSLKQLCVELATIQERLTQVEEEQNAILGQNSRNTSSTIPAAIQSMNAQQITKALEKKSSELKNTETELDRIRQSIREDREMVETCRNKLLKLRQDKVDIDSKQQRRCQLDSDIHRVEGELQRCKTAALEAQSESVPNQGRIQDAERRRSDVRKRKEAELREITERGQKLKEIYSRLCDIDEEIKKILASGAIGGLGTVTDRQREMRSDITRIAGEIEMTSQDLNLVAQEINEVSRSVEGQKAAERELNDAIMLGEKREKLLKVSTKKKELEAKMRQIVGPGKSLRDRQVELRREESDFLKEKVQAEANRSHLAEQLKGCKAQLKEELFMDVDKKYREMKAKHKIISMANEDLKSYYRLVDKALLTFHTRKMGEINRIIGEIWQQTYKGGDIDTIEIQSDVDTVGTTDATKRRTYNYRVVMKKGDAAMDMRGRCSAGQKVLASIIIRLALSEAFAGKCHVLALDEPTTNLDRDNIASLAHALVKIINMRAIRNQGGQVNFQLVVITHDTDFIELLGHTCEYVEQFYMLQRDDRGETRITRNSVDEVMTSQAG